MAQIVLISLENSQKGASTALRRERYNRLIGRGGNDQRRRRFYLAVLLSSRKYGNSGLGSSVWDRLKGSPSENHPGIMHGGAHALPGGCGACRRFADRRRYLQSWLFGAAIGAHDLLV